MWPVFAEVARRIRQNVPNVQFILPVAPSMTVSVQDLVKRSPLPITPFYPSGDVETDDRAKRAAFQLSNAALATSGTVALELARANCPMVVAYKANYLTTRMVKKLAQIDTANLINIVTDTRVIPEFLFENCTPDAITPAVLAALENPDVQKSAAQKTMQALGLGGPNPGLLAAQSVLRFIQ